MKVHKFYKDETGWYIDLPGAPFTKGQCAMVAGADTLLDKVSEGGSEVLLALFQRDSPTVDGKLDRVEKHGIFGGATYTHEEVESVWLCPVTLYVFRKYPKTIYYSVISKG